MSISRKVIPSFRAYKNQIPNQSPARKYLVQNQGRYQPSLQSPGAGSTTALIEPLQRGRRQSGP